MSEDRPGRTESPARDAILAGRTSLGIELGSTRIKACLVGEDPADVLAVGSHAWQNELVDGFWTYSLDAVRAGLRSAYADLVDDVRRRHGVTPSGYGAIGVSAMMHGYLAFDEDDDLLVPFRTWRNTSTGAAAAELTELFGATIPLRWSIAHLHQAVLDAEPHLARVRAVTTLAGYVHERLTGQRVVGVGDASGMFPIDPATRDYDEDLLRRYDALAAGRVPGVRELFPRVLTAGTPAGELTAEGAAFLDPTGTLAPGVPFCPPEGDAGTGMVATNAVAPRTGNVSAGTSIFAMVVLERPLGTAHAEIDVVTTPVGDPVAMVHSNNGAGELAAWAGLFGRFAAAAGVALADDEVFGILLREALDAEPDAGGLLAFNTLAGEPVTGVAEGRPLLVRAPDARLTLANLARAQLSAMFAPVSIGMHILHGEGVALDGMVAHGGVFRTAGVAQRMLAAALGVPVTVGAQASEGGAWGMAVLAAYLGAPGTELAAYLDARVFAAAERSVIDPDPADVAGFDAYLDRYRAGLAIERAAADAI